MDNQGEIILYQPDNEVKLEVRMENETVWLNRGQIAELFARDVKTIGKHVNNALKEELKGISVVAKFATTAADGKVYQVEYYKFRYDSVGRLSSQIQSWHRIPALGRQGAEGVSVEGPCRQLQAGASGRKTQGT